MSNYGESSIGQLQGATRVRTRPAAILGNDGLRGAQHCFNEIVGNSLDEVSTGHGSRLDIMRYKDGSISVRDYGRGVPLGWNEAKKTYNWHLVYNEMYGGGKYDDNQEKLRQITDWTNFDKTAFNYLYSVGLNGLGASATQYCSEYFHVVSIRKDETTGKNMKYEMHFKDGLPIIDGEPVDVFETHYNFEDYNQIIEETDEPTGTFVHWKPDARVFTDVNITADWLLKTSQYTAFVAGIDLNFKDEETGNEVNIPGGSIEGLLPVLYNGKLHVDSEDAPQIMRVDAFDHGVTVRGKEEMIWVAEAQIAFGISKNTQSLKSVCFHNYIEMLQGSQYTAIQGALDMFLTPKAKQRGLSLQVSDYEGVFVFALSSFSNLASFRNQTKDGVDDTFIYTFIRDTIHNKLELEYNKGTSMVVEAVDRVMKRADLRLQLKEAEKQIKKINKIKKMKDPEKFLTCEELMKGDYHRTELWITEGDSARDSVANARDGKFQAVFGIRGKGLNLLKASIQKMLDNTEVMDIISLLGTGIDLNIKGMKLFNIDDLRFDKIIIATDADVDGFQIRVLLFVLFYRLAPRLIQEGHVYIAETPRYALVLNNGERVYALDEKERDEKMKEYIGQFKKIERYKGLGEVNAEVLHETTVGVEHRRLVPVTCDFDNELECDLIDALFGADKRKQRKDILSTVLGQEVTDDFAEQVALLNQIEDENIEEGVEYERWE